MIPKSQIPLGRLSLAATFLALSSSAFAAPITKSGTGTDLTAGGSWVLGTTPVTTDIATWDGSSLGAGLTAATGVNWNGINATDALTDIGISGAGVISLGNGGITLAGPKTLTIANAVALSATQTWDIADVTSSTATDATVSGIVSGAFALTKAGEGTLQLTGANTYNGLTTINAGTLNLTGSAAKINSSGVIGTGSGSLTLNSTAIQTMTLSGNVTTTSGNQSYTGATGGSLYSGIEVGASTVTLSTTGGGSITMVGDIGKKDSSGNTLTLDTSAGNGTINLDVSIGRSNAWYNLTGFTANAGTGTINWTGSNASHDNQVTPITLAGAINFSSNFYSKTAQTLTLNTTGASTASGIFSGAMSLVKEGNSTLISSGRNTYTGLTTVNAGTLRLNDARSMNGAINVNSGATLSIESNGNGGFFQPSRLDVTGATVNSVNTSFNKYHGIYTEVINVHGSGLSSTISTPLFMNKNADATARTLVVTVDSNAMATISGAIGMHPDVPTGGSLTKAGTGTLTLTGANTFTGNMTINGGTVNANLTVNTGTPTATALGNMTTVGRTITINSGATLSFGIKDAIGKYNYKTPVMLIADGGTITRADGSFNSLGDVTLKNGAHLTTANGNSAAVNSFALNGNVTVTGTSGSFIDTTGTSFNGLHLGTAGATNVFDVAATGDATADLTVSARLLDKTLGGAAGFIKTGAGKMVLSGANTYTGATTVNAGELLVNGNQGSATGATTVAAGNVTGAPIATLSGNGTIGGSVSLAAESSSGFKNGGVLAPTASASGTALDVAGTTTFGSGSIFEWNLVTADGSDPGAGFTNQGSYGQLAGAGAITGSNAVFRIVLSGNSFASNFWDTNKSWTNVFTGAGATIALDTLFTSFDPTGGLNSTGGVADRGQFSFNGSSSTLSWTAVPEPTSALAGLLLTAGLLRRSRSA